jgi:hypothetical protein
VLGSCHGLNFSHPHGVYQALLRQKQLYSSIFGAFHSKMVQKCEERGMQRTAYDDLDKDTALLEKTCYDQSGLVGGHTERLT